MGVTFSVGLSFLRP